MRKSVAWSIIYLLAALSLRLFGPVDPSPQIRDTFVSLFAGGGLVCAGFALCETGPLARAREAMFAASKARTESDEYSAGRIRRLESARENDLRALNCWLAKAASLEESNKSLSENGTALFKRLEKAERIVAVLRSEIREVAKDRNMYGSTVAILGRVLDGGRFVGKKIVTDTVAGVVRECREKYRNPNLSDEQKRALLSVEIQAGALLRLAPPGKGGAAFTVESVPLVADGPAPARRNLDLAMSGQRVKVDGITDPFKSQDAAAGENVARARIGDLVTMRSLDAFVTPSPLDSIDFLGLTYQVVGFAPNGNPLIAPRNAPGLQPREAWAHLLDCIGHEAVPEKHPFRLLDRVVFKDPFNKENPRVYVVTRLNLSGSVTISAENDNKCVLTDVPSSDLRPAGGTATEAAIDLSQPPGPVCVGERVRVEPDGFGIALDPDEVFTVVKGFTDVVDLVGDKGSKGFSVHRSRLVRV